jgi:hypothetical protein
MGTQPRPDIGTRISNYSLIVVAVALALAVAMGLMAQSHWHEELASERSPESMYVSPRMMPPWTEADADAGQRRRFATFILREPATGPDEASAPNPGRLYDAN